MVVEVVAMLTLSSIATRRSRASAPDEIKADESEIKEESVPNEEAEEDNKRHSEEDQGQVTRRVRTRRSAESSGRFTG